MANVDYKEIVLKTLLIGGLLSVAVLAPNALQMITYFADKKSKYNALYSIKRKIYSLQASGHLKFVSRGVSKYVVLTPKGKQEVEKYLLGDLKIKTPKQWDKKWRIVSFDVKNKRTPLRNLLRYHLKRLGFVQYQKSIWIYPYECEEVIIMLKSYFKFGKEVMYVVADRVENDKHLRAEFDL